MNLILNVNKELHSVKGSVDGEKKIHAAIADAIDGIKDQARINVERVNKGLNALPYNITIKDEYGKDFVTIKETKSLEEIRKAYKRRQSSFSYDVQEKNLLQAMDNIGNSKEDEYYFKKNLNKTLNSFVLVNTAELNPVQEKILDYFGDMNGLMSTINFKEDIAIKCIKDLIALPAPKTGKPPKEFEELLSNIMAINKIFRNNPNRENYIETARTYINIRYQKIVPKNFRFYFKERGGLFELIKSLENEEAKKQKINYLEFEVSEKNFKKVYQSFYFLEEFKNKPLKLTTYLFKRVPDENKGKFARWLKSAGFSDQDAMLKTLIKWADEVEKKQNQKKENTLKGQSLRGE